MRNAFLLLCLAAGLLSCAKDALNSGEGDTQNEGTPMTFNVTVAETKAVKADWANGDKIYVFFNGLATKYLVLTYDGTEWTNTSGGGTLLDSDFSDLGTKTLTAVHFPVAVDVSYDVDMDSNGWFSFTSGGEPVYTYYLFERDTDYTVSGTTVTASLSMGKPDNMALFHVAGIQGHISDYTFGSSMIVPVACASVGTNGLIFKSELATGERVGGIADNDGGVFAGRLVRPGTAQNYNFYLADKNKIYALTRTEKTLTAGKMYNFPAPSVTGGANWDIAAVNLGLKSGGKPLYWATRNIGATTETDYGYYFAWGETMFKDSYTTSTYLYYHNYWGYTEYNSNDGRSVLQTGNDAARQFLKDKFRMPTYDEFFELRSLTSKWETNYQGSGINGWTISGNGNTIFLPATGYREGSTLVLAGSYGYYWSSSLYTGDTSEPSSDAWFLKLDSSSLDMTHISRSNGLCVRPVSE